MPEISLPTKLTQDQIKTIVDQILFQVNQKNTSKVKRSLTVTKYATWYIPSGVTELYVTGGGAGGSGSSAGSASSPPVKGNDGTDTVLTNGSNVLRIKGGKGGEVSTATHYNSTVTGGNPGGPGGQPGGVSDRIAGGNGGNSGPYFGGIYSALQEGSPSKNGGYCSGGAGGQAYNSGYNANGGGGGDFIYNLPFQVTPLTMLTFEIGKGGAPVAGATGFVSGAGGDGILTIEWWE